MYIVARADGISTMNATNHIMYHGKSGDLYISPLGASGYSAPAGTGSLHDPGAANSANINVMGNVTNLLESGFREDALTTPVRAVQNRPVELHLDLECCDDFLHTVVMLKVLRSQVQMLQRSAIGKLHK